MISLRPEVRLDLDPARRAGAWRLQANGLGGQTWRREGGEPAAHQAQFAPIQIPAYSDDVYNIHLQSPGWTKEETDYLMGLCRTFNLRFPVIADRYDPQYSRSVVDLKERFYEVEARLSGTTYKFDTEWERKRRLQIESFHDKPTAEQQEELFIMDEIERVVRVLPDILVSREATMLAYHNGVDRITLDGLQPTLNEVINGPVASSAGRRKGSVAAGTKHTVKLSQPTAPHAHSSRRDQKRSVGQPPSGAPSRNSSQDSVGSQARPVSGSGPGRKPKPFTYPTNLSSLSLAPIRVGLCRQVDRMMADYGLPIRPAFGTPAVVAKYDEIRALLARLADAKKALEALQPAG